MSVALGTVIEQKQMAELPLIDRSYSKLIVLAPGANEVPPATAGGQFQQFFGRQPQYTVSGARPEGQVFLMDNTNVQNYWNRGSGSGPVGNDARRRGDRRIPGADQHLQRAVRRQRRRDQRHHEVGHESVARLAVRVLPQRQVRCVQLLRHPPRPAGPDVQEEPVRRQFRWSARPNKAFYFVTYEGLRQTIGQTQAITVPDANARNGIINGVNVGVNPAIAPVLPLYPLPTRQTPAQAAQGIGHTDVTNETSRPRELLRRPLRLHDRERHEPVRALHRRSGVGVRAELGLADPAVEQR